MAKRKRSGRPPQARHAKKSIPSRPDKRRRLSTPNHDRRATATARVPLVAGIAELVHSMSRRLDPRIAFRLPIVIAGAMFASGRRTAASWFRCAGVQDDWDRFYELLQSVGKHTPSLTHSLLIAIREKFDPGDQGQWVLAVDDSPTKRAGRHVEGATIHRHPTPGPGDGEWLYGHNWVCVAMLLNHSFGVIALPLLSMLYVRKVAIEKLKQRYNWKFRTKHELALEMLKHVIQTLRALGSKAGFVVVFDGAYAAGELIRALMVEGATVVTRIRRDADLRDIPVNKPGKRGRPRKYGEDHLSLSKRAGHPEGWKAITYACRGVMVEGRYKTFLATSPLVGGRVRVVLLEHASGNWAAYISTDTSMSVEAILKIVSDRWAIEEHFHDVKEIWGAGQQQVRNVWSNIGCWNLCGWLYGLVELASWDLPAEELVDRSDRPWDNPSRRPSHADRRRRIIREMLRNEFLTDLHIAPDKGKIKECFERLLSLAT
jgi:hypothetical protein